jgi:ribonucleoside-diphosphate reductase beta chain
MEIISLQGKTNFFEKRVGDYQKSGACVPMHCGQPFSAHADDQTWSELWISPHV